MARPNKGKATRFYRLSLVEDETHVALKTIRFTKFKAIFLSVCAVVALITLIYCVIAFTPLRSAIPGYPDAHSKKTAVANAIKIDSLESLITKWDLYAQNLSRVLSGDKTISIDSIVSSDRTKYLSAKSQEELNRKDSLLREQIRQEEQFDVSGAASRRLPIEGMHFFPPVKGVISQPYDRNLHPAIDITAPGGAVVSAVYDGVVVYSAWDEARGNVIMVQHPENVLSIYGHNRTVLKKAGESVKAGTPIALVGNTGKLTTGEHLHFELWCNGESVNPSKYISF